jgi:hypothetical protein
MSLKAKYNVCSAPQNSAVAFVARRDTRSLAAHIGTTDGSAPPKFGPNISRREAPQKQLELRIGLRNLAVEPADKVNFEKEELIFVTLE